ncbi:MAG: hypothetical protein ACFWTN_00030 [Clostridium sp.]
MGKKKVKIAERYYGIDIIKILAIILVPSLHFFLNYGFYEQQYVGLSMVIQESIRWISFTCIGLFILASGYLQCNREINKSIFKKVLKYVIPYFFYCVLTTIIIDGTTNTNIVRNILYFFLRCPAYFWYMSFFLGFYLLIPFFNLIVNNTSKTQIEFFIITLILVISIPSFINSLPALFIQEKILYLPNWWNGFFPIVYYCIGAYFRKYQPKLKKETLVFVILLTAIGISLLDYLFCKGSTPRCIGGDYGSIVTVILSVSIFALFFNLKIEHYVIRKVIRFISNSTLHIYFGYIISDKYTRAILEKYFAPLLHTYQFKLYFIEFPLNFLIALLIAIAYAILHLMTQKLYKGIFCKHSNNK